MVNAIYWQLSKVCFVLAAIFTDILLIRFCLVLGNMFIIINSCLGWPLWPNGIKPPIETNLPIDSLVWSTLAFFIHLWAFSLLVYDERSCKRFEDKESEILYQFFKTRSGIRRRDFLMILNRGQWTKVEKRGTVIPTQNDFHLIVEGSVNCKIEGLRRREKDYIHQKPGESEFKRGSGDFFELQHANIFSVPIGFFNDSFVAESDSDNVLLFSWSLETMTNFAKHSPPVISQTWKNIFAFSVADVAQRPFLIDIPLEQRHPDFHYPDEIEENHHYSFVDYLKWIIKSMDFRPPRGLRHKPIPTLSINCAEKAPIQV